MPADWVEDEDIRVHSSAQNLRNLHLAQLVLKAYWTTMEYHFGSPGSEEHNEFSG
jgi:hypothetical protein